MKEDEKKLEIWKGKELKGKKMMIENQYKVKRIKEKEKNYRICKKIKQERRNIEIEIRK